MKDKKVKPNRTPNAQNSLTSAVEDESSELNKPCWSIISFEKQQAKNLTYNEALKKINKLKKQNISGLCIITNEAAERISN